MYLLHFIYVCAHQIRILLSIIFHLIQIKQVIEKKMCSVFAVQNIPQACAVLLRLPLAIRRQRHIYTGRGQGKLDNHWQRANKNPYRKQIFDKTFAAQKTSLRAWYL